MPGPGGGSMASVAAALATRRLGGTPDYGLRLAIVSDRAFPVPRGCGPVQSPSRASSSVRVLLPTARQRRLAALPWGV